MVSNIFSHWVSNLNNIFPKIAICETYKNNDAKYCKKIRTPVTRIDNKNAVESANKKIFLKVKFLFIYDISDLSKAFVKSANISSICSIPIDSLT